DEYPARFQPLVPGQPELPTVDLRPGIETEAFAAPRITSGPVVRHLQLDRTGHAADREVAHHPERVARVGEIAFHAGAPEGELRVIRHVEEVRGPKVVVPLLHPGVDARRIDVGRDLPAGTFLVSRD